MARNFNRNADDWFRSALTGGAVPLPDGGLELATVDRVPDPFLRELAPGKNGRPGGTRSAKLRHPPVLEGHVFYLGADKGGRDTLSRQTPFPEMPGIPWVAARARAAGPRPAGYDPSLPRALVYKETLAQSKVGFAAPAGGGKRLGCVLIITEGGAMTTTTEPVEFAHNNGEYIEFRLPAEMSEGGELWGLCVSDVVPLDGTPDPSTIRLQEVAPKGTRRRTLTRPYRSGSHGKYGIGRLRPTRNETFIGKPPKPDFGPRSDIRLRHDEHGSLPMALNVSVVEHTGRGPSRGSVRSETKRVGDGPGRDEPLEKRVYRVKPDRLHPDTEAVDVYCQIEEASETWYRVVRKGRVYRNEPFRLGGDTMRDGGVPVHGYVEGQKLPDGLDYVLVAEDPPGEDLSGVEAPAGEIDPPRGVGASRPPAGTYPVTYAPRYAGDVQAAAVPVKVTIGADELIVAEVPSRANRVPNAGAALVGADGRPLRWGADLTGGILADATGRPGVRTSGSIADAGDTPARFTDWMPVDHGGGVEAVAGRLEVSLRASGTGRAVLEERLSGGGTRKTPIKTLSANGDVPFFATVGPPGSGASIVLGEDATDFRVRGDATGNPRSLMVRVHGVGAHPLAAALQRFVFPPDGQAGLADPSVPPETPYAEESVVCVTVPKPPQGSLETAGVVPVEDLDLNDGADPQTKGWTRVKTSTTNVVVEVTATAALEGIPPNADGTPRDFGARFRSEATNQRATGHYWKTYPIGPGVDGKTLGVRALKRYPLPPTRAGNMLLDLAIGDQNRNLVAFFRRHNNGQVRFYVRDRAGKERWEVVADGVTAQDIEDAEIVAGGGGTKEGVVTALLGLNGQPRRVSASVDGVDLAGLSLRTVWFGGIFETDTAGRWEVHHDRVRVTPSGDVLEQGEALPPGEAAEPLDRPAGANGLPREEDEDGNLIAQLFAQILPGERHGVGFVWREFVVVPGAEHTLSTYASTAGVVGPAQGPRLTLHDRAGNAYEVGSVHGDAGVSGDNPWHETAPRFFTPPPGFYRAVLWMLDREPGVRRYQEPLVARGRLESWADRDAARTERRATEGTATTTLAAGTPAAPQGVLGVLFEDVDLGAGFLPEVPEGAAAAASFRGVIVGGRRAHEVSISLSGGGGNATSPTVPPGGAYAEFASYLGADRLPTLTFADGTPLPGGTLVDGLEASFTRPDYDPPASLRGLPRPKGGVPVERLHGPHRFYFMTERGAKIFEELCAKVAWAVEAPDIGGTEGSGTLYVVRLYAPVNVVEAARSSVPPSRSGLPERYAWGVAEVGEMRVVSSSPLPASSPQAGV